MRDGRETDAKFRLSDGRDVQDVLRAVEALAERAALETTLPVGWVGKVLRRSPGDRFYADSYELVQDLPREERLRIAATARETWRENDMPAETRPFRESWLRGVELGAETWRDLGQWLGEVLTSSPDEWRGEEKLAREFLARVDELVRLPGGNDLPSVLARARDDVLYHMPDGGRRGVLERVLDLEETMLRESGAAEAEVTALESARHERRERGWQTLRRPRDQGRF